MQALSLRASGATFRQIAAALGVSEPTAWRLVRQESESFIRESAAEVLELELTRLDRMLMGIWPAAINGDLQAIDRALKIEDMRAKLLGLYDRASQPDRLPPRGIEEGVVIIARDASQEDFIAGMRAIRGELPLPPSNGNGQSSS